MYDKKMIKIGRVSMGLAIIANFIPAIYVGLRYGEMPGIATILQIWALVAASAGSFSPLHTIRHWVRRVPILVGWQVLLVIFVCLPHLWHKKLQAWNQVPMRGKLLQQSVLAVPYLFPQV